MDSIKHGITVQRLAFTLALIVAVLLSAFNRNEGLTEGFYISNYVILSAFSLMFIYRILFREDKNNNSRFILDMEPPEKVLAGLNLVLVIAWLLCQISYFQ